MGAKKYYLLNLSDNSEIILEDHISIGRKEYPEDKKMSKLHCEVSINQDDVLSIKDLGSKNKTWINDESIPAQRAVKIYLDDIIKVGQTKFQVHADGLSKEESFTQTKGRTSGDEFTFIIENPITAHDEEEAQDTGHSITFINNDDLGSNSKEGVGTGIAHTMSKMVKTTFGIIKQRYTSSIKKNHRSRENEIDADEVEERKIELSTTPFRGTGKAGQKYKKFKKLEQNVERQKVTEYSGKAELLSPKAKLLLIFFVVGAIICYFLTAK